ncbi:MAG: type VI secretion system protein ImpK [bacterium]|jgi:type VI secretion system protein ImpK
MSTQGSTLLIQYFQEFYQEIILLKEEIRKSPESPQKAHDGKKEPSPSAKAIFQKVYFLIENKELRSVYEKEENGQEIYKEVQFVMAALADEIFLLHMDDWGTDHGWRYELLETKLFSTRTAGEEFFKKIDRLIEKEDPKSVGLAAIYLYSLSLGFRGKYWIQGHDRLKEYRNQLYYFIYKQNPQKSQKQNSGKLVPEAHIEIPETKKEKKFPSIRKWLFLLFVLMIFHLIASHGIWLKMISDTKRLTNEINKQSMMSGYSNQRK